MEGGQWSAEIVEEQVEFSVTGDILIDENGNLKMFCRKDVGENETRSLIETVLKEE